MALSRNRRAKILALPLLTALSLTSLGCATAPADGRSTDSLPATVQSISQEDRQEGAKAHPELVAEFGGAMPGRHGTYVETVGKNIAVQSGLSNARDDFTVTLLNSPINNAFAIPGGYVYVTRQLTALMNNEAELAAVLGHEVGHVAAQHAKKRQQRSTRNSIIGMIGQILSGVVLGDSQFGRIGQQIFSQGAQLLTLSYSRDQEIEADNLGIAYLQRAGYDPRAMSTVLNQLAQQNALEAALRGASNRVPEWASTHPDPASRVRDALQRAGANATGLINRDTFLANIEGMTYGDDPKQGIVDGRNFTHPVLNLYFQAPEGFYMVNGVRSVAINGQSGRGEFSTAPYNGDMENYIRNIFKAVGGSQQNLAPQEIRRTTINGLPAAYGIVRTQGSSGQVDVIVFAYEFARDRAYHFTTITAAGQGSVFSPLFNSFRRISATEAGRVKARQIDIVTVRSGDTIRSLASRMAYDNAQVERFMVLNGLDADDQPLPVGSKVKIVRY
jgi:predicted Zn-dependent protease